MLQAAGLTEIARGELDGLLFAFLIPLGPGLQ
jgi:hypothetical protein